jgi:mannonate dehydratase
MIQIAEYFGAEPNQLWKLAKQSGVDYAVGTLPVGDCKGDEKAWDFEPMARMKKRFDDGGLSLDVIESSPPMQKARLGIDGRDEEIEWFNTMLRSMGKLGIGAVCYNWMAVIGWTRTRVELPARGGSLVTGYFHEDMENKPPTDAGEVSEDSMWENLQYFLDRVVPVAEEAKVHLAMHPDDPPRSPLRGLGRIMRTVDNYQRLLDMAPSPYNGITLCQGNFALMTDDLPNVIRHFGEQKAIHFVHFRDVIGTPDRFVETYHEVGKTDMLACMKAYKDIGFDGVLRPDHVPTMEGDTNDNPCYSTIGRIYAIGYIKGLREAVYGKEPVTAFPA